MRYGQNTSQTESSEDRFKRYQLAESEALLYRNLLEQAYSYTDPKRANFNMSLPGQKRGEYRRYDSTAVKALSDFANNIQSILMPPERKWANLVPSEALARTMSDEAKQKLEKDLQDESDILFSYINRSNFNQEITPALKDMGISTAVMYMNEGATKEEPFYWTTVSISEMAFEKDFRGRLETFYRTYKVKARDVMILWPKASPDDELRTWMNDNPNQYMDIVLGTIYYPENKPMERYCLFVQDCRTRKDLYIEHRDYSPWLGIRWGVQTGESFGFGPVLDGLEWIRLANRMTEFTLKAAQWRAFPPFISTDAQMFNNNFGRLEPGMILPVGSQYANVDPIRPIPMTGDPQFGSIVLQEVQQTIKDMLFANPLMPPDQSAEQTATEVSTRQQNWIRTAGTSFGRIYSEGLTPAIDKMVRALRKHGLIGKVTVDGQIHDVRYESPVIELQRLDDFNKIVEYLQFFTNAYGPQMPLLVTDVEKMPGIVAEKLNVDRDILLPLDKIKKRLFKAAQAVQQQSQQQPAQPQSTPVQTFMGQMGGADSQGAVDQ